MDRRWIAAGRSALRRQAQGPPPREWVASGRAILAEQRRRERARRRDQRLLADGHFLLFSLRRWRTRARWSALERRAAAFAGWREFVRLRHVLARTLNRLVHVSGHGRMLLALRAWRRECVAQHVQWLLAGTKQAAFIAWKEAWERHLVRRERAHMRICWANWQGFLARRRSLRRCVAALVNRQAARGLRQWAAWAAWRRRHELWAGTSLGVLLSRRAQRDALRRWHLRASALRRLAGAVRHLALALGLRDGRVLGAAFAQWAALPPARERLGLCRCVSRYCAHKTHAHRRPRPGPFECTVDAHLERRLEEGRRMLADVSGNVRRRGRRTRTRKTPAGHGHRGGRVVCAFCAREFRDLDAFQRHRETAGDCGRAQEREAFVCSHVDCSRACVTRTSLAAHSRRSHEAGVAFCALHHGEALRESMSWWEAGSCAAEGL